MEVFAFPSSCVAFQCLALGTVLCCFAFLLSAFHWCLHVAEPPRRRCVAGSFLAWFLSDGCLLQQVLEQIIGCRCPIECMRDASDIVPDFPLLPISFHLDSELERVSLPNIEHWTSASPCSVQLVYELEQLALLRDVQYICHATRRGLPCSPSVAYSADSLQSQILKQVKQVQ